MTSYAFRVRVRDELSDERADRVYDTFNEELAIEEGPRGTTSFSTGRHLRSSTP